MIGYTMVGTNNLVKATAFYNEVLGMLGLQMTYNEGREVGYSSKGKPVEFYVCTPFNQKPATLGNGSMVAFQVDSKEVVDAVHQKALELGGVNEGAPGPRPADGNVYYCYFRDLDGNKICAYANL